MLNKNKERSRINEAYQNSLKSLGQLNASNNPIDSIRHLVANTIPGQLTAAMETGDITDLQQVVSIFNEETGLNISIVQKGSHLELQYQGQAIPLTQPEDDLSLLDQARELAKLYNRF